MVPGGEDDDGMPGRAADLIEIPDSLWHRAEMTAALRERDIGSVFLLVRRYTGTSQTRLAIACSMSQPKISGIMRGVARVEALEVFERIADGLGMPDQARTVLGLAPKSGRTSANISSAIALEDRDRDIPSGNTRPDLTAAMIPDLLGRETAGSEEDGETVRRRTFVGLTSASLFGAVLADSPTGPGRGTEPLTAALTDYSADGTAELAGTLPDVTSLAFEVAQVKRSYQACRYATVTRDLPALITRLQAACALLPGPGRLQAYTLSAEAHHVAARILLKAGDHGLGWVAADRSMQAAHASEDPVTIGSSARIIAHAMMASGHLAAAAATAAAQAERLDRAIDGHDPASLSVYGSLLLSGAVAASGHDDRSSALELLAEAEEAGRRLGADRNLRWTAFGPTNAQLHRVNIALALGDAGTALDVARTVDLGSVILTERKATFLIDAARAYLQCGKHERSYVALRAAEHIAPEEITGRRAARDVVTALITTGPPSVQRQASEFGQRIGIAL
jgi:transcriptional regulator with XRE-family HTH domain